MTIHLRVSTPDKLFFDAPADGLVCPGLKGYFGVLQGHLPLIGGLGTGVLKVRTGTTSKYFVIDGGMAEVQGQAVDILANAVYPSPSAADAEEELDKLKSQLRPLTIIH